MILPPQLVSALLTSTTASIPVLIGWFAVLMQVYDVLFSGFSPFEPPEENYDFIVVGAGSAGATIAARLSEDDSVTVLLIEAGGDPNPITYVPATVQYLNHPEINWNYMTTSLNNSALASENQEMPWPRGKSVGGSSNINFMIYNRGNAKDYNRWADLTGDIRWGYKNLVKYFLKIEDYHGYWDAEGNHNKGGPLRIEALRYDPLVPYILHAAQEQGFPVRDANNVQTPGFNPLDFTQKRGTRFSTYRAYIRPAKKRPNLAIYRYAQVNKILFAEEEEKPRAIGVTYERHGVPSYAYASKEVIISCGTVASPQLLMLSGIGPKNHLLEHGIPSIVNLPGVGQNLQDHVSTFIGPFLINRPESYLPERDLNTKAIYSYIKDGSGPLSLPLGVASIGLGATTSTSPDWPNIIWTIHSVGVHKALSTDLNTLYNTEHNNLFGQFLENHIGEDGFFIHQGLGLPKSSGYIRLRDNDPKSPPIINPQYYKNKNDLNSMLEGIQQILRLVENTTSLGGELGARLSPTHVPGCEPHPHRSRDYWECVIRTLTSSVYHPAGTCKMGTVKDTFSVVDTTLRVKGVDGLRIGDCSIMPRVTNANLNAPAIVIGEMCADLIKETWTLR